MEALPGNSPLVSWHETPQTRVTLPSPPSRLLLSSTATLALRLHACTPWSFPWPVIMSEYWGGMHSAAPKLYKESCETGKEEVSLSVQSITFCRLQSLKVNIHKNFMIYFWIKTWGMMTFSFHKYSQKCQMTEKGPGLPLAICIQ